MTNKLISFLFIILLVLLLLTVGCSNAETATPTNTTNEESKQDEKNIEEENDINEVEITEEESTVSKETGSNFEGNNSPVSKFTDQDIKALGISNLKGTDKEIAEAIMNWQANNMVYADAGSNFDDVSYSMRWNYAFSNTYTSKDMIDNMKTSNGKIYGICYNYALIYASIADYYGLDVRITNTTVKPSEVSNNPFYKATAKGMSPDEYNAFISWISKKGLNADDYPYEAVRLVMGETALHYRAEVFLNGEWVRMDKYNSDTDGATKYSYIETNWSEGENIQQFNQYVQRIKAGEDLRGEGYSNTYDQFLEGRLIAIETGSVDKYTGITDDLNNTNRAKNINDLMQGLGLVPYLDDVEGARAFMGNNASSELLEELDLLFEVKELFEEQTGKHFYALCDILISNEDDDVSQDSFIEQYHGFTGDILTKADYILIEKIWIQVEG